MFLCETSLPTILGRGMVHSTIFCLFVLLVLFFNFTELPHLSFLAACFLIVLWYLDFYLHHPYCLFSTQFPTSFAAIFTQCETVSFREPLGVRLQEFLQARRPFNPSVSPCAHWPWGVLQHDSQCQLLSPHWSIRLCRGHP